MDKFTHQKQAVITVGDGRGFIVEDIPRDERYVITAGHCLPRMPPCMGASYLHERTFQNVLACLGQEPSIACECLFVDPVADIAVLGVPDAEESADQADAFTELVGTAKPLAIAEPPSQWIPEELAWMRENHMDHFWAQDRLRRSCPAYLLSLKKVWFPCTVSHHVNGALYIEEAEQIIEGGMSGSPIIAEDGTAVGMICLSDGNSRGGPNPRLVGNLPGWLLRICGYRAPE